MYEEYRMDDMRVLGALAAARGDGKLSCPLLRRHNLPSVTGEPIGRWLQRVRSWESGWQQYQDLRTLPRH